jgi:hypothetical protein
MPYQDALARVIEEVIEPGATCPRWHSPSLDPAATSGRR